ncbi:unnamed protein product [Hymenolepis diminuta]|uniref:Uncharacterized protein n=1 Tax=Hymenolepis diminuta TaxID=6216 RepID=A0A564Y745_HYMDI|nr:unnamed protein product [Hymenolepis diminuta]
MTHNLYLPCLNAPIDFPPFYNRFVLPKNTSALMFSRVLTQQHTPVSYRLLRFLLISSLPQHTFLSISLFYSFQTRCGFLEYILM